jgi:hypothetical protein
MLASVDSATLLGSILEKEKRVKELRDGNISSPAVAQEVNELLYK